MGAVVGMVVVMLLSCSSHTGMSCPKSYIRSFPANAQPLEFGHKKSPKFEFHGRRYVAAGVCNPFVF
jgi:hypothetical protein